MNETKELTAWETKMLEFIMEHREDPDLLRLPLSTKLLALAGITKVDKPISIMEATKRAFGSTSIYAHQYKGPIVEQDQSKMDIKFPEIPEVNKELPLALEANPPLQQD
jgi:hypothetical protein